MLHLWLTDNIVDNEQKAAALVGLAAFFVVQKVENSCAK
jgi:hypothetical protein